MHPSIQIERSRTATAVASVLIEMAIRDGRATRRLRPTDDVDALRRAVEHVAVERDVTVRLDVIPDASVRLSLDVVAPRPDGVCAGGPEVSGRDPRGSLRSARHASAASL